MHGFLNINKPYGITSFTVIRQIKKILNLNKSTKIGHLGTLDPMATGVLPIAIGQATKLIPYIPDNKKSYRALMTLGGVSDTQDALGNITYYDPIQFQPEYLPDVLSKYTGEIEQIPPMYSAVHHQGQRLYQLARQGQTVERAPRKTSIFELKLNEISYDEDGRPQLSLYVACSSGTYVRTLCHDIGHDLGTGAYLNALARVSWGEFSEEDSITLETLADNWEPYLCGLDYPLQPLPGIVITAYSDISAISHGNAVGTDCNQEYPIVKIYNADHQLLAIAKTIRKNSDMLIQPIRVLK